MDISRTIKDVLLITPYLIVLIIGIMVNTLIYLFLSFNALLIFIYEKLKWK